MVFSGGDIYYAAVETAVDHAFVVPLERIDDEQGRRFFVGNLFVGNPQQELRVLFDSSSIT